MKPPINESHPERVAPRLKLLRKLSNMTQKELCELLEIQPGTYNHYERGLNRPDVSNALKLCAFHGVTLDYLFSGKIAAVPHEKVIQIMQLQAKQEN